MFTATNKSKNKIRTSEVKKDAAEVLCLFLDDLPTKLRKWLNSHMEP